jgi:tetratricopeptide (TPR) repeat protein
MIQTALDLFDQEKPLEALKLAERACELAGAACRPGEKTGGIGSNSDHGRLLIARICLNLGRFEQVERECRSVIRRSPSSADAHYLLGVAHQKLGNLERCLEYLQKAVYLDSDHSLAHFALAELHAAAGEHKKAARAYKNTLRALEQESEEKLAGGSMTITKRALAQLCTRKLGRSS